MVVVVAACVHDMCMNRMAKRLHSADDTSAGHCRPVTVKRRCLVAEFLLFVAWQGKSTHSFCPCARASMCVLKWLHNPCHTGVPKSGQVPLVRPSPPLSAS